MSVSSTTIDELYLSLAELPSVELKGMALLREHRPHGQFFPQLESGRQGIPRETIAEDVSEIVGYTECSRRAAQQLAKLTPIPLIAFSILNPSVSVSPLPEIDHWCEFVKVSRWYQSDSFVARQAIYKHLKQGSKQPVLDNDPSTLP